MPVLRRRDALGQESLPDDMPPLLRRVFAARGIHDAQELNHKISHLLPVSRLNGIDDAVRLLLQHLKRGAAVTVVGDFDADGATGTVLIVRALRALGFPDVRYLVPNRFEHGYGLTPEIVTLAARGDPGLLITVDNGITSVDGVNTARGQGIDVLITDHHLPGEQLPAANVIVNPNLKNSDFPSKYLAGVGVAFYVMAALARETVATGFQPASLLDLVALGTIADVVPLDFNNRVLVHEGIERIRAGRCCAGIKALLNQSGRKRVDVTTGDLAFAVAPRLNAAGRLTDMSTGIECLLTDDPERARELAGQLDRLNRERRDIESKMQGDALEAIATELPGCGSDDMPLAVCLYDEGWHPGVVGLVASRVKEQLHRPVVAFARDNERTLKGSARSVPGCHMRDVLALVEARNPGTIQRFGGHAMAAGLSLDLHKLEAFRTGLVAAVAETISPADLENVLLTDGELDTGDLNLETATLIRHAAPWGQAFPEPLFDGRFVPVEHRVVGGCHLKLRVKPSAGGPVLDAIAFNCRQHERWLTRAEVTLVYRLDVNEYRGIRSLQLVVEHIERG